MKEYVPLKEAEINFILKNITPISPETKEELLELISIKENFRGIFSIIVKKYIPGYQELEKKILNYGGSNKGLLTMYIKFIMSDLKLDASFFKSISISFRNNLFQKDPNKEKKKKEKKESSTNQSSNFAGF